MRLIDADAIPWFVEGVGEIPVITKEEIDEMPTVDAVPVIRCRECKYFTESERVDKRGWCSLSQHGCPMSDDYCSDAERMDEDEVDAVPVVRCRDCKWSHDGNCIKHGIAITDDFFCAGGERRD